MGFINFNFNGPSVSDSKFSVIPVAIFDWLVPSLRNFPFLIYPFCTREPPVTHTDNIEPDSKQVNSVNQRLID